MITTTTATEESLDFEGLARTRTLGIGDGGTGKTHVLGTALDAGVKVRLLAADPNCLGVAKKIVDAWEAKHKKKLPVDQFSVCVPERNKRSLKDIIEFQEKTLGKTVEAAYRIKTISRTKHTAFVNILGGQQSFIDVRNKQNMGSCADWGTDTLLAVDSLTVVCQTIWGHILGDGLKADQADYGIMQANLMQYFDFIINSLEAHLYMMAHPRRETNQITLKETIFPATIGTAVSDKIINMFGDVVWCYKKTIKDEKGKEKTGFFWSTDDRICITRHLLLPQSTEIPQDFGLILNPKG
jgi:hypothetical protein